jgi:hypothetical protein
MNYYETLAQQAESVEFEPSETSYFSESVGHLDSRLFRGATLIPNVRNAILVLLKNHLELGYNEPMSWIQVFLAGSGVSFNWQAHRAPADLDCLVSVDYIQFRQSNQEYKSWSDREIATELNQGFKNELHPRTESFMDSFELTFYVNTNPNIEEIKPYAAYSVTNNSWVVSPSELTAPVNQEWDLATERDKTKAIEIIQRYSQAWTAIQAATNTALRLNAETMLANAVHQGSALFQDIHESRSQAFSPSGLGYSDFTNYRWQSGKRSGVIPAMKKLHDMVEDANAKFSQETYGMELPDVSTLIRRTVKK